MAVPGVSRALIFRLAIFPHTRPCILSPCYSLFFPATTGTKINVLRQPSFELKLALPVDTVSNTIHSAAKGS